MVAGVWEHVLVKITLNVIMYRENAGVPEVGWVQIVRNLVHLVHLDQIVPARLDLDREKHKQEKQN